MPLTTRRPDRRFGHAVAYNSPGSHAICRGGPHLRRDVPFGAPPYDLNPGGVTLLTGTVHQGIRFPTPKGISELEGDPGIVAIDSGSSWTIYTCLSVAILGCEGGRRGSLRF